MIAAMLPYLLWQHAKSQSGPKASALKKWFKPVARRQAEDAFWCPKDGCVKNQSDMMLAAVLDTEDELYWETDSPKPHHQSVSALKLKKSPWMTLSPRLRRQ